MNYTGIILAGGKSVRMGQDKCFVQVLGKNLIDYVLDIYHHLGIHKIIINTNQPESFTNYPHQIVTDIVPNKGPLMGIYSSLVASKTDDNIIIPCDSPFVSPQLIHQLIENNQNHEISFPAFHGRNYPLIGCYKKHSASFIKKLIDNNELKASNLEFYTGTSVVKIHDDMYNQSLEWSFANINNQENLKYYEERIPN